MNELIARIKVVLTAAPAYLTAVAVAIAVAHEEIAGLLPEGVAEDVGRYVVVVLGWLGAAVSIIRRVTPVAPSARGLLPTVDIHERLYGDRDRGQVNLWFLVIVALVVIIILMATGAISISA